MIFSSKKKIPQSSLSRHLMYGILVKRGVGITVMWVVKEIWCMMMLRV